MLVIEDMSAYLCALPQAALFSGKLAGLPTKMSIYYTSADILSP